LILRAPLEFPDFVSNPACDLIARLLNRNYKKRLGSGSLGSREIQKHPLFNDIDWGKLFRKEVPPPWSPNVKDDFDVRFFDTEFTSEAVGRDGM
jgi:serine/threonine protein kinase